MEQEYKIKSKPSRYDIVKNHLIQYRFYQATIERRKERLEELTGQMEGIKGTDYSADKVQTSQVESIMDKLIGEKLKIEDEVKRLTRVVRDIERGLKELDQVELFIVENKWIYKESRRMSWWRLAVVMEDKGMGDPSPDTVKYWGRKAVNKMAGIVFID